MRRKLIVLMGLDGSGKTLQANMLADWLNSRGERADVVWMRGESYITVPLIGLGKAVLRGPRETKRGAGIADRDPYEKYTESKKSMFKNPLLRSVWRSSTLLDHYISFRKALGRLPADVTTVILDRYVYDSMIDIDSAFGSGGREAERLLESRFYRLFPRPDKVVLLEIPPEESMKRKDDIPSIEYLESRYPVYHIIAERVGAGIVDATKTKEEVQADIRREIEGIIA
jgi:thymidylate kinase